MKRRLGRTDIEVAPIGLGCWQFSEGTGLMGGYWDPVAPEEVRSIVEASIAGGVTWFDTAEIYGKGRSEAALSRALQEAGVNPGQVVVATKWWPVLRTAGHLTSSIGERLRALDPFPIDLYQVHQPLSLSSVEAEMAAMADLVAEGRIRAVGVSNFDERRMRRAHASLAARGIPLASNQVRYSLVDRAIERNGVLAAAQELGITVIAWSPLGQGLLTGKFHEEPGLVRKRRGPRRWLGAFRAGGLERTRPLVEALRDIGAAHGASSSQVALAWLVRANGDTVVAIPGASRRRHAEENAGALTLKLAPAEMDRLEQLSRAAGALGGSGAG